MTWPDLLGRSCRLMRKCTSFILCPSGRLFVTRWSQTAHILLSCYTDPSFIPSPQSLHGSGASLLLILVGWDSMAVSVIDTRRDFKLVPYSGDDEHWPQWVLKFEAWSEVVGWERQLDAAAASTLPIVNTMLEAEVQTISRQLNAILVVKFEGKALGIVQLVNKGEGLEAWRQLK